MKNAVLKSYYRNLTKILTSSPAPKLKDKRTTISVFKLLIWNSNILPGTVGVMVLTLL